MFSLCFVIVHQFYHVSFIVQFYECIYKYFLLYAGRVEDEFVPTRGNICIFTSICT